MQIVATNIGEKRRVRWGVRYYSTGIFKYPSASPIFLGSEDVVGDDVVDRKYHGGIDKACYIYSADFYASWKEQFPHLEWDYGMFGENLTLSDCDEKNIKIGDQYAIGDVLLEISEPREPCVKLAIRFHQRDMVKRFVQFGQSGFYARVLKEGYVTIGDTLELVYRDENAPSIFDLFRWRYHKPAEEYGAIETAMEHPKLAESFRKNLAKIK